MIICLFVDNSNFHKVHGPDVGRLQIGQADKVSSSCLINPCVIWQQNHERVSKEVQALHERIGQYSAGDIQSFVQQVASNAHVD